MAALSAAARPRIGLWSEMSEPSKTAETSKA